MNRSLYTIDPRSITHTSIVLMLFASNSILCRLALLQGSIDAASFTFIRLLSGAIMLWIIVSFRDKHVPVISVRWITVISLFGYAAPFSFAYLKLSAGTGALILFGAVQVTMIGTHIYQGKRLQLLELLGLLLGFSGLVVLTFPGLTAPDLFSALLMTIAGISWGVYSLKGRAAHDPLLLTTNNFLLSLLFASPLFLIEMHRWNISLRGFALGVASGALASGVGYALWYSVLRKLDATKAGIIQLLSPVIVAIAGVLLLGEQITFRLLISGMMIVTGVSIAIFSPAMGQKKQLAPRIQPFK